MDSTPTPTDAIRRICDDPKIANDEFCFTKGTMKTVLTAAEARNAELERENEWWWLLIQVIWSKEVDPQVGMYGDEWEFRIDCSEDGETIYRRTSKVYRDVFASPADATVAKIKEAVGE